VCGNDPPECRISLLASDPGCSQELLVQSSGTICFADRAQVSAPNQECSGNFPPTISCRRRGSFDAEPASGQLLWLWPRWACLLSLIR